jgi:hypothetical protein
VAEANLVERRRGGAVHIVAHEVEHTPGGKAFERQKGFRAGELAQLRDLLHVDEQLGLVDQIIGGLKHCLVHPGHGRILITWGGLAGEATGFGKTVQRSPGGRV